MILTTTELDWISDQMKTCKIKYQEIYDEIFDHMITAVEERRRAGDNRAIQLVFQQIIDEHFNGYTGVESLAVEQARIYCVKVKKLRIQSFKHYLSWPVLAFIAIAVGLSLKIPNNKLVSDVLKIVCTILAISPCFYAMTSLSGKMKTSKGKKSILESQVITQAVWLILFYNSFVNMPQYFIPGDKGNHWSLFYHLPTPVLILVVIMFAWANLATIRFCKVMIATKTLAYN
jgi:hypothetical protein